MPEVPMLRMEPARKGISRQRGYGAILFHRQKEPPAPRPGSKGTAPSDDGMLTTLEREWRLAPEHQREVFEHNRHAEPRSS